MECKDFLRNRLVLREHEAVSAGTCVLLANQFEIRGNLEIGGVVAVERLAQVEHHIAVNTRESQEALQGPVDFVEDRLGAQRGRALRPPLRPRRPPPPRASPPWRCAGWSRSSRGRSGAGHRSNM